MEGARSQEVCGYLRETLGVVQPAVVFSGVLQAVRHLKIVFCRINVGGQHENQA